MRLAQLLSVGGNALDRLEQGTIVEHPRARSDMKSCRDGEFRWKRYKYLKYLVRTAGLEPALPGGKQILSLLRLPFRHVRLPLAEPLLRVAAEGADQRLELIGGIGEPGPVGAAHH